MTAQENCAPHPYLCPAKQRKSLVRGGFNRTLNSRKRRKNNLVYFEFFVFKKKTAKRTKKCSM